MIALKFHKCKKIQSLISFIYLFLFTLRCTMKANIHISNKLTACVSFSEQADVKFTPSKVGTAILCGKTFGKEEKKCAKNLQVSDFLLNTHTHTQGRRILSNSYAHVIYLKNSCLQYKSTKRKKTLFADFCVSCPSILPSCPCHLAHAPVPR